MKTEVIEVSWLLSGENLVRYIGHNKEVAPPFLDQELITYRYSSSVVFEVILVGTTSSKMPK